MIVGSANLNEHSSFNDTETNVVSCDPVLARGVSRRSAALLAPPRVFVVDGQ